MGAYTCQFGIVHKTCRCPMPHSISCDVPENHKQYQFVEISVPANSVEDKIDPSYYKTSVEAILINQETSYNLGNAIKYLWRLGKKNPVEEELKKTRWYIKKEISRLETNPGIPFYAQNKKEWAELFESYILSLNGNERLVLWAIKNAIMKSDVSELEDAVKMLDVMIKAEETKTL